MKTLHLNLKKQWFDMILAGEKKEEYRDIKPFWLSRLTDTARDYEMYEGLTKDIAEEICEEVKMNGKIDNNFNHFDTITFSNGYAKKRRQFEIKLKSVCVGTGFSGWGSVDGKKYFILNLGEILSAKNCN